MTAINPKQVVTILYTNYRGEKSYRKILPQQIIFSSNEWHPEEQWLLEAFDIEKQATRLFAIKDIHEWKEDL
jgi:predicted DNA-binding transcriptional regulator YafY